MNFFKPLLMCVACFAALSFSVNAQQDSTGMPGDNFSLQGALEMFKQSASPEEFEKLINSESKNVNNLDLNGDGDIDYIRVIDKADKDVHAFVLQVVVSETENQDIAVIEIEKTGDTTAVLQIVGDEEIFGEQIVVEASDEGDEVIEDNNNGFGKGPSANFFEASRIVVNVFFWPGVRFVYRPVYVPWVSPWRWHHYPNYWRPWHPYAWHVFHPLRFHYHRHCAIVHTHRVIAAHKIYAPHRVSSVTVRTRTTVVRNNYKVTHTTKRTVVKGPRGNTNVRNTQNTNIKRRDGSGDGNNGDGNKKGKGKGRRG
jgi:hypothetical protein